MFAFNTHRFLREEFVNAPTLHALLNDYKMDGPTMAAVEKWFQRGSVGTWLPLLMCLRELETGEPVKLTKYLEQTNGNDRP